MEVEADGLRNITKQKISRKGNTNIDDTGDTIKGASVLDLFSLLFPDEVVDTIIEFANSSFIVNNTLNGNNISTRKFIKKKAFFKYIASELLYSISTQTSYEEFLKKDDFAKKAYSKKIYQEYRTGIFDGLTNDAIQVVSNKLKEKQQLYWRSTFEEVVDELLAQQIFEGDLFKYLTNIPRKPHPLGLCYYMRCDRKNLHGTNILYVLDWEESIFLPKISAADAAKKLLLRSNNTSATIVMDNAFFSEEMLNWLEDNKFSYVLACGDKKYSYLREKGKQLLPLNTHVLLQDKHERIISFTNAVHYNLNTGEQEGASSVRVAVSNSYNTKKIEKCTCKSELGRKFIRISLMYMLSVIHAKIEKLLKLGVIKN